MLFFSSFCSSNDPDELAEPEPEMDLEIQMAFKDFVKSQHQKWSFSCRGVMRVFQKARDKAIHR